MDGDNPYALCASSLMVQNLGVASASELTCERYFNAGENEGHWQRAAGIRAGSSREQQAARSYREMLAGAGIRAGAAGIRAGGSREQHGAARSCRELQASARSCRELLASEQELQASELGIAGSNMALRGAAWSCMELQASEQELQASQGVVAGSSRALRGAAWSYRHQSRSCRHQSGDGSSREQHGAARSSMELKVAASGNIVSMNGLEFCAGARCCAFFSVLSFDVNLDNLYV
eukprot:gene14098-20053_t